MLILPDSEKRQQHHQEVEGVTNHFNTQMEKILNTNKKKDIYWILGKIKTEMMGDKVIVRPFLQSCDEKPGLIKESFVYEVDNKRGVKTLLWVFHTNNDLSFPSVGKKISVPANRNAKAI